MGSSDRSSKKKVQLWKKAIVHFGLCFVMGFFTGFAPAGKASIFYSSANHHVVASNNNNKSQVHESPPQRVEMLHQLHVESTSWMAETPVPEPTPARSSNEPGRAQLLEKEIEETSATDEEANYSLTPRRLIIMVTPTTSNGVPYQAVLLRRLANTIRLVPPPLLWIVVERKSDSNQAVSEILRKTGIMYRHLVFNKNLTDPAAELDHQRNVALKHIEHHRLSGIVHFAALSNIYHLHFFEGLRQIEVFGTWPIAILRANKNKVIMEGPVCDSSSQVIGWHLKEPDNNKTRHQIIHISSFGFNSSILWDPERWGRPSSSQVHQTSQDSIKFVKQVALEDETKLKGIPPEDCSKIMLWTLHLPISKSPTSSSIASIQG